MFYCSKRPSSNLVSFCLRYNSSKKIKHLIVFRAIAVAYELQMRFVFFKTSNNKNVSYDFYLPRKVKADFGFSQCQHEYLFFQNENVNNVFWGFFSNCYLVAQRPTLGHFQGGSPTKPMSITAFLKYFDPKVTVNLVTTLVLKDRPST